MAVRREQLDGIRRIHRHEDESADALLELLLAARLDVRARLEDASEVTSATLLALDASIGDALRRVQFSLRGALADAAGRAVTLGTELGAVGVPAGLFRLSDEILAVLSTYRADLIRDLTDDLRGAISRVVQLGVLSGADTTEIAREIGAAGVRPVGPFRTALSRAEVIARTEVNRVANLATHHRLLQANEDLGGGLRKRWVAARDSRVRPSHRAANGQTVPVGDTFTVGGFACQHPLDPALPARESVHCRCRSVAVLDEE